MYFITHPEIIPDPSLPLSLWDYSDSGAERWEKILKKLWIKNIEKIYSSPQQRARKAAQQMADELHYELHVRDDLDAVGGSNPEKLSPEARAAGMQLFYKFPQQNMNGWEKATDAQKRIIHAIEEILKESPGLEHVAVVCHEDLGNLLICDFKQIPIQKLYYLEIGARFFYEEGICKGWEMLEL